MPAHPGKVTVLMYHAISQGDAQCAGADPHYTVRRTDFRAHLAWIREAGLRASSVAAILASGAGEGRVALTFDDGHESSAAAAADILEAGGTAELFVNPSTVGTRNHLGWDALAELAKRGISIQSHGQSHRYFDELSEDEIEGELRDSKSEIEDRLGQPVVLFAPPGGRLTARVAEIAARLGYRGLCSSEAGLWSHTGSPWRIPRIAVLAATREERMRRWIAQDRWEVARIGLRHAILAGAKRLLGNRGYERLRSRLLAGRGGDGSAP